MLLVRALRGLEFDRRAEQLGLAALVGWPASTSPSQTVARVVYWTILILGLLVSLTALNATIPSRLALSVFEYLPHLLAALMILVVGAVAARFLARSALIGAVNMQIQSARLLSLAVKWLVLLVAVAMALDHLGIGRTCCCWHSRSSSAASCSRPRWPSGSARATSSAGRSSDNSASRRAGTTRWITSERLAWWRFQRVDGNRARDRRGGRRWPAAPGPAEPTLTFSGSAVGREADVIRRQLDRFARAHPSIKVALRATPDAADQRHQLYVQWLNARSQRSRRPAARRRVDAGVRGRRVDCQPRSVSIRRSIDFFAAAIAADRWNGALYALPWFVDVGMLYWRTDLVPQPPRDLADLSQLAKRARRRARGAVRIRLARRPL